MRFRYEVTSHSTRFLSIPDRPVKSYPFKFLAKSLAAALNLDAKEYDLHMEYYVVDTEV